MKASCGLSGCAGPPVGIVAAEATAPEPDGVGVIEMATDEDAKAGAGAAAALLVDQFSGGRSVPRPSEAGERVAELCKGLHLTPS